MSTVFDVLTPEQQAFLLNYIRQSGDLHGEYPGVSASSKYYEHYTNSLKFLEIQKALGIFNPKYLDYREKWPHTTKTTGSDLIRAAYYHQCLCGHPYIRFCTAGGEWMKVLCEDQCYIGPNKPNEELVPTLMRTLNYEVFDMIVQFTTKHGGKAKKGNGTEASPEDSIARHYKEHFSVYNNPNSKSPSLSNYYILLEEIGVINNRKSYIEFTDDFKAVIA